MFKMMKRVYKNYKKFTIGEKIELFVSLAAIVLAIWFVISWLEIGFNAATYGYEYSKYNIICWIFDLFNVSTL